MNLQRFLHEYLFGLIKEDLIELQFCCFKFGVKHGCFFGVTNEYATDRFDRSKSFWSEMKSKASLDSFRNLLQIILQYLPRYLESLILIRNWKFKMKFHHAACKAIKNSFKQFPKCRFPFDADKSATSSRYRQLAISSQHLKINVFRTIK